MATAKQYLTAALGRLDNADDAHWTTKGLPNLNVIDEYMRADGYDGRKMGRKDMPKSFKRVKADPAPADANADPKPGGKKRKAAPRTGVQNDPPVMVCYRGAQARPQTHHCPVDGQDYTFTGEFKPLALSPEVAEFFCGVADTFVHTDADGQAV